MASENLFHRPPTTTEDILNSVFGGLPGQFGIRCRRKVWSGLFKYLGNDVRIFPNCEFHGADRMSLADNVQLLYHTQLLAWGGSLSIGVSTSINGAIINASGCTIRIGADCLIAHGVVVRCANHVFSDAKIPIRVQGHTCETIILEDDVWVGANATILPGAHIKKGSIVSAGAVVTRGVIEPYSVVGGVPAKLIRHR